MKDKHSDDQASKPNAGVVKVHSGKGDVSTPNAGGTPHPEKVRKGETISTPNAGGTLHTEKADGVNRVEQLSDPKGGGQPIPKEQLHLDKHKAHENRTFEPKPKGETTSSGHPFKSTKRN